MILHLTMARREWEPPVIATSATTGEGVRELWDQIKAHRSVSALDGGAGRASCAADGERGLHAGGSSDAGAAPAQGTVGPLPGCHHGPSELERDGSPFRRTGRATRGVRSARGLSRVLVACDAGAPRGSCHRRLRPILCGESERYPGRRSLRLEHDNVSSDLDLSRLRRARPPARGQPRANHGVHQRVVRQTRTVHVRLLRPWASRHLDRTASDGGAGGRRDARGRRVYPRPPLFYNLSRSIIDEEAAH